MNLVKKVMALAVVLVAGAWAYHANSGRASMDMNARVTSGNTPFPVVLASVERQTVRGTATYTGSVAPFNEEDIYPRVMGRILDLPVYPGDRVEKGQVVARLDDIELTSKVREAEGMVATAQANRTQMQAEVSAARQAVIQMEKELVMAQADAGYQQKVAARDEQLYTKGAIAKQDAESSQAMATAAQAKVDAAQAKIDQMRDMETSTRKKLEAMNAMVTQNQTQVRTAEIVRGYITIQAPSSGVVVKRLVAPGVLVQPGMAILKITQVDKVRLQANVGEKDLGAIRVGSPVTVTTSGEQTPIVARVTSVFPYVDPGARTAVVESVVENANRRLIPGQYVQMQFTTGERKDAVTVPASAVSRLGGKATVWALTRDEQAEPREVTTGLATPNRVEILKGLTGDERVVVQGQEGLYAGAKVTDTSQMVAAAGGQAGMPGMAGSAAPQPPAPPEPKSTDMKDMPGHGDGAQMAQTGSATAGKLQIAVPTNKVKLAGGSAKVRVEVKDASGAPVSDARVDVAAGMPGMNVGKVTAKATKDPGVYEATLKLGMAGSWTVDVSAASQGGTATATFPIEAQ
jgi:multidrug efflux pump subunit AcrA (membrane-fusion protein)